MNKITVEYYNYKHTFMDGTPCDIPCTPCIKITYKNYLKELTNFLEINDTYKEIIEKEIELYEYLEASTKIISTDNNYSIYSNQIGARNSRYLIAKDGYRNYFINILFDTYYLTREPYSYCFIHVSRSVYRGSNVIPDDDLTYSKTLLDSKYLADIANYSDKNINMAKYINIDNDIKIAIK